QPIRRHTGKAHAVLLEPSAVAGIDLVAVAMALRDFARPAVDFRHPAAALEHCRIGAEPHGAAEVALHAAPLQLVALHPFRHQPDDGFGRGPEFGRVRVLDAAQVACRLDHRHLHAETDAEIRHLTLARELRRLDLAFRAALAETARDENAVDVFEERS